MPKKDSHAAKPKPVVVIPAKIPVDMPESAPPDVLLPRQSIQPNDADFSEAFRGYLEFMQDELKSQDRKQPFFLPYTEADEQHMAQWFQTYNSKRISEGLLPISPPASKDFQNWKDEWQTLSGGMKKSTALGLAGLALGGGLMSPVYGVLGWAAGKLWGGDITLFENGVSQNDLAKVLAKSDL